MVLVDTSVWIDHLSHGDALLLDLLQDNAVVVHPFIIGEIMLGNLPDRAKILAALEDLPFAAVADHSEVMRLVDGAGLAGAGIGWVDAHLVASARLTRDASLWTHDKRLAAVADRLAIAARLQH